MIIHQLSGNFSGFAIELKTPRGTGVVSPEQRQWLDDMGRAGYRVLLSSSLAESIHMVNEYMQSARVCCALCGKSFVSERTLQTHEVRQHPAAIVPMQATYASEMGSNPFRDSHDPSRRISEMGSNPFRDSHDPSRGISEMGSADDGDICSICSS